MILDATKAETDALLDLLDAAVKARGLNMAVWASHWALKIKAAEAKAAQQPQPKSAPEVQLYKNDLAAVEGA